MRAGPARGALLLALLAAALPAHARAQPAPPFSRLELSASGTLETGGGELHRYWRPGPGVQIRAATPFYLGTAAVSAHWTRYGARGPEQPDFRALTGAVEWALQRELAPRLRAGAGVQVGLVDMTFADPTAENPDENELTVGARAALSARVAGPLRLELAAVRRRVLTRIPIRQTLVSLGAQYPVATPGWLRRVLE